MDILKLTNDPLNVDNIYSQVVAKSTGAVSIFVGTTRDHFENEKVLQLEYEAYIPMAEKEMGKICQQIREKWKVENIAIYHRLGIVPVCEASVVIAISSEHRVDSLEAIHYGIDNLKKTVPIWKKEIYDHGVGEWKANKESSWINTEGRNVSDSFSKIKKSEVPAEYIQIKASKKELDLRINSFMERKRRESDMTNIQEFCHRMPTKEPENSCARTEAILVCRKDSKSHLKVSRVENVYGPQTQGESFVQTSLATQPATTSAAAANTTNIPPGIEERLLNMEEHLSLHNNQSIPKDIYSRLKQLEERILYLESVSPEYFNEDIFSSSRKDEVMLGNIETRIAELRRKLKSS